MPTDVGLEIDFQIYCTQRQVVTTLIHAAKTNHYRSDIQTNSKDQKLLFRTIDRLLYWSTDSPLPSLGSPSDLVKMFNDFFVEKVTVIHQGLVQSDTGANQQVVEAHPSLPPNCSFSSFRPAATDEVMKLLGKAPATSCELDSMPTWLLKQCSEDIVPTMTSIINLSLESGTVPSRFKLAHVRPLLKKPGLDVDCLNNYRPVSNLSFLSKQTERVVAARLTEHMSRFDLFEPLQSAYKANHSCETALIRVQNDILRAMDDGKVGILVLLDLSAAFDTINHAILLDRLQAELGLSGKALAWFKSYLQDRHQLVTIQGKCSDSHELQFGVPQGSVLGPQLFTIYTTPLGRIICAHGLDYHFFADDSQLYIFVKPTQANINCAISLLQDCCEDIRVWMRNNFLKLNDGKTEAMLIGSKLQVSKISLPGVSIGDSQISPAPAVRDLGAVFDTNMTMTAQVNTLCQSARFHIRNIGKVPRH